jgi:Leucine-rich repeat (LRR) protein
MMMQDESAIARQLHLAQRLGVLSCSQQQLAALPRGLTAEPDALAAVQVVDAAWNCLRAPPAELLGCIDALLVLDLSCNALAAWPAGLCMPSLAVLNVSFCKLQSLPEDMGRQLPRLQQLFAANNFLEALPDSLAACASLQDVFLSENAFTALPQVRVCWQGCGAAADHVPTRCGACMPTWSALQQQVLGRCLALVKLSVAACQLAGPCEELAGLTDLR